MNKANLSYIPIVSISELELEVADLKALDLWVNKFKPLNENLEKRARQQAELVSKHKWAKMKELQPADQLILKTCRRFLHYTTHCSVCWGWAIQNTKFEEFESQTIQIQNANSNQIIGFSLYCAYKLYQVAWSQIFFFVKVSIAWNDLRLTPTHRQTCRKLKCVALQ